MTSCGCFIWGTMTTGFAFCTSIAQGVAFWAINGIGEPIFYTVCRSSAKLAWGHECTA